MSTTVVVARAFRGQRLYLVSSKKREFTWTANRALALPLSIDVAMRIIEECEEFAKGTDAFAIDKNEQIIAKVSNGAITRLAITVKCVYCSRTQQVTEQCEEMPLCECGGPMIAVKAVRS